MNRFFAIVAVFVSTMFIASGQPKIAVLRLGDIYRVLPSSKALREKVKTQQEGIMKSPNADELRKLSSEMKDMQEQLNRKGQALKAKPNTGEEKDRASEEADARKLATDLTLKQQEVRAAVQEFEEFRKNEAKQINSAMVKAQRASFNKIIEVARKIAQEQGCDLVFESGGNTNTGLPFILYQKNKLDITETVKAEVLKLEGPTADQPAPKETETAQPALKEVLPADSEKPQAPKDAPKQQSPKGK